MGLRGFSDLLVYRRSVELADELHAATAGWESFDRWTVGVQLVRAADSVGANIAEAWGRETRPDRRRLVFIARGSTCELEHWLARANERGLELPAQAGSRAAEVGRMLNGLLRGWS